MFKGKSYKIYDGLGSKNLPKKGNLHARIALVEGKYYLVGANPIVMPITYTDRAKKIFHREFGKTKPSARDIIEMLLKKADLPEAIKNPPIIPTAKQVEKLRYKCTQN